MATPSGTQFQVATDSSFANKLIDYSGAYKTSHVTASGTLTKGVPLYSRVRHASVETSYSDWSSTKQFSIANYVKKVVYFNNVVGYLLYYHIFTQSFDSNSNLFYVFRSQTDDSWNIVKLNKNFNIQKVLTIINPNQILANFCIDASDNVIGVFRNYDSNTTAYYPTIVKYDNNLNVRWCKKIVFLNSEISSMQYNFIYTDGDEIIIGIQSRNIANTLFYSHLLWVNTNGEVIKCGILGGGYHNDFKVTSITKDNLNNFYISSAYTVGVAQNGGQVSGGCLMKITDTNSLMWVNSSNPNISTTNFSFHVILGSTIIVCDYSYITCINNITKDVLWQKTIPYGRFGNMLVYSENIYILYVISTSAAGVIKMDMNGNVHWIRSFKVNNTGVVPISLGIDNKTGTIWINGALNYSGTSGYFWGMDPVDGAPIGNFVTNSTFAFDTFTSILNVSGEGLYDLSSTLGYLNVTNTSTVVNTINFDYNLLGITDTTATTQITTTVCDY